MSLGKVFTWIIIHWNYTIDKTNSYIAHNKTKIINHNRTRGSFIRLNSALFVILGNVEIGFYNVPDSEPTHLRPITLPVVNPPFGQLGRLLITGKLIVRAT